MANPLIAGALVKLSANQIKRALKNLGNCFLNSNHSCGVGSKSLFFISI